jgi:hypothetical protein
MSSVASQSLDAFRLREIEQQLTAELQRTRRLLLTAATEEARRSAFESRDRALQRMKDLFAKGVVPEEFL